MAGAAASNLDRRAFLRASALTGGPGRETATFREMDDCWTKAAALFDPVFEPVQIPYEGTRMPGWFLRPDASGTPRKTIIVNNGSDGQTIDTYAFGGAAAIERGWNALLYYGPGQGTMLFERRIPFRPDWEKVVTPVVDYLLTRPDVDPKRIAISGWSMCGELVGRAAAFEHRLAAVVLDPGAVDVIAGWRLPKQLLELVREGKREEVNEIWRAVTTGGTPWQRFDVAKRSEIFEAADGFDLIRDLLQYTNRDVLDRITSPTLVLRYQLEQFFPGQAEEAYHLLTCPKEIATLTVAEGAQYHDAPMAPQQRNEVVYDWLDTTLG